MITIPRSLVRQVRAVTRKLVRKSNSFRPQVSFQASVDGLRVRVHQAEISAEYLQPGSYVEEILLLPLDALADFEGRNDAPVTLEATASGVVLAKWEDAGIPQVKEYAGEDPEKLQPFPDLPESMAAVEPGLVKALDDASRSAAPLSSRYALDHIQLRGSAGQVVATDGRQLLVQSSFALPFSEDVLVLATPVFGCRELTVAAEVIIGKTATHVCLRIGAWIFHLPIDKDSRFPKTDEVIPSLSGIRTRCHLDSADTAFAVKALPKLPGGEDQNSPITMDLNGQVVIRAREAGQIRITELVLARSTASGPPLCVCINRQFLGRALNLGLAEVAIPKAEAPLMFHDERRQFVVMPLNQESALAAATDAVRIASSDESSVPKPAAHERRKPLMKNQTITDLANEEDNGSHKVNGSSEGIAEGKASGITALISEAEALRTMLRDAHTQTGRLLVHIKRHKKQPTQSKQR